MIKLLSKEAGVMFAGATSLSNVLVKHVNKSK